IAKRDDVDLILLHVLDGVLAGHGDRHAALAAARTRFDARIAAAQAVGVRASDMIVDGVASEEIVRVAKAHDIALIVMGTHGHTGYRKTMLGSVAERVVGAAPCPVLTVRTA